MNILAFDTSSETCSVCLLTADRVSLLREDTPRKHAQLLMPMISQVLAEADLVVPSLDAIAFGCGPGSFTGLRIATGVAQGLSYGSDVPVVSVSNLQALALRGFLVSEGDVALSVIDARMDELYWGLFQRPVGLEVNPELANGGVSDPSFLDSAVYLPELLGNEQVSAPEQALMTSGTAAPGFVPFSGFDPRHSGVVIGSGYSQDFSGRYPEHLQEWLAHSNVVGFDHQSVSSDAQDIALLGRALFEKGDYSESAATLQPTYLRNEVAWKKLPGR